MAYTSIYNVHFAGRQAMHNKENQKEVLKRAEKYYQSGKEIHKENLVMFYGFLTEKEQEQADTEIRKLLPSWGF